MASQDDILSISDVASVLKMAEKTVYGLAQKGYLPALGVWEKWRFRRTANDSWIDVKLQTSGRQMTRFGPKPFRYIRED